MVVLQPSQSLQMFLNFYVDIHLAGFEAKPSMQHMFQNFDVYINLVVLNKINCCKCFNNLDVNEAKSVTINVSKWRSECSFGDVQELSQSQQIFLNCDVHVHLVMLKPSQSQQISLNCDVHVHLVVFLAAVTAIIVATLYLMKVVYFIIAIIVATLGRSLLFLCRCWFAVLCCLEDC